MKGQYSYYFYTGYKQGKTIQNLKKAVDVDELQERLNHQNIKLIKAKRICKAPGKVSSKEIVRFSSQMSSMIKNGIQSVEAMQMYAQYAEENFQFILLDVLNSLSKGSTLADSFKKTGFFSQIFCESVNMGEASSHLDESFNNICKYYESELNLKKKMKSMMTYPIVVLIILLIITIIMSTVILPKFADVYSSLGASLPMISLVYIRFGRFITSGWWMCIAMVVLLKFTFSTYKKSTLHKKNLDRFKLNIPLASSIYKTTLVARFSNVLALYLQSGIQIQESLLSSARILQNNSLFDEFVRGTNLLLKGKSFYEIVDEISVFPPFYKQVVYTGERAGDLVNSLIKLATSMDKEANDTLDTVATNINQFIVVGLMFFLAPTIMAIIVPVFNLTKVTSDAAGV